MIFLKKKFLKLFFYKKFFFIIFFYYTFKKWKVNTNCYLFYFFFLIRSYVRMKKKYRRILRIRRRKMRLKHKRKNLKKFNHDIFNPLIVKNLLWILNLKVDNYYFFWRLFTKDYLISCFINLIMRSGKKYNSYKTIYNSFFFLKTLIGVHPINVLKYMLYDYRFIYNIQYITKRYRVVVLPKLLPFKSQVKKSINFILNGLNFKNIKIKNKSIPFYKKISYLITNFILNEHVFKRKIWEQRRFLKKKTYLLKKEEFKSKYVNTVNTKKHRLFRVRKPKFRRRFLFKSFKKKERFLNNFSTDKFIYNKFLLDSYHINLLSKKKVKFKWI